MKITEAHVQHNWWKYLLVVMASVLLWSIVFDSLSAPAKNEKIQITFLGDGLNCAALEEHIFTALPDLTTQKIEKVAIENPVAEVNNDFYTVLATRVYGADLIIIEESLLTDDLCKTYFLPLPVEQLADYVSIGDLYVENGVSYGLLLNSDDGNGIFSEYYSGSQRVYLFIPHTSVNVAGIMGEGKPQDDAALRVISYLLEER
jgi:hypothetical protein